MIISVSVVLFSRVLEVNRRRELKKRLDSCLSGVIHLGDTFYIM